MNGYKPLAEKLMELTTAQYMKDAAAIQVREWLAEATLVNPVTGEKTRVLVLVHSTRGEGDREITQQVLKEYLCSLLGVNPQ